MKRILQTLGALAFALMCAGSAQAIPLSELLNGRTITAGDKLFDQWTEIFQGTSDGHTINTAVIDVTALNDGGMNPGPGLQFDILNGEFNVTGDGLFAYNDFTFGFRVSVLNPNLKIKANSLQLTGVSVTNSGDNGSFIKEMIGTGVGLDDLGEKTVEFSWLDPNGLIQATLDTAAFAPQSEIFVSKNILVWATDVNETAMLLSFSQRFSQQTTVPEPATFLLFGAGLGAIALRRRSDKVLHSCIS